MNGPLIIMDRDAPAHVVLSFEDYRRLDVSGISGARKVESMAVAQREEPMRKSGCTEEQMMAILREAAHIAGMTQPKNPRFATRGSRRSHR